MTYRLCLVGYGKIARDQHAPVITAHRDFELVSVVSRSGPNVAVPVFTSLLEALTEGPDIDAVILCTPPGPRGALALDAISAGKSVFLEKPPTLTVSAAEALSEASFGAGVSLFASWHSRFAPFVEQARHWAHDNGVSEVQVDWREDVLKWHPGQDWLWQPGGMGVFDPGINALSILTEILPMSISLSAADLHIPDNKSQPIKAGLRVEGEGLTGSATFDFQETGTEVWQIKLTSPEREILILSEGGAGLQIGSGLVETKEQDEYRGLYDRFAELLRDGISEMDLRPLQLVADAFLCGTHHVAPAFHDPASAHK
ncbi:MAG: Gfo/Idh/MocA family oxidoreductase [Pseudomonadota bacterium]